MSGREITEGLEGGIDRRARILSPGGGRDPDLLAGEGELLAVGVAGACVGPVARDQELLPGGVGRGHLFPSVGLGTGPSFVQAFARLP
jgi:hypothetical protein